MPENDAKTHKRDATRHNPKTIKYRPKNVEITIESDGIIVENDRPYACTIGENDAIPTKSNIKMLKIYGIMLENAAISHTKTLP